MGSAGITKSYQADACAGNTYTAGMLVGLGRRLWLQSVLAMKNIPEVQSVLAIIFTPITGAIAIGVVAYHYITSISHYGLGIIAFAGALIGVECVGGACCYALIKCHRERDYGAEFCIALAGTIVYIVGGILTLWLQNPIIIFFALSPFSYFAYTILKVMKDEIVGKTSEVEAQIKLVNAQKNLINAETRREKASSGAVSGVRNRPDGQAGMSDTRQKVFEYMSENPSSSVRNAADELGLSKSTVGDHVKIWREQANGHHK